MHPPVAQRRRFFYAIIAVLMKKFLKIAFIFLFVLALAAGIGLFWAYQSCQKEKAIFINQDSGSSKITINESEKYILKKIKNFIYREATIHNPEGDVLPDQLDDNIIKGIKNRVE